jgi:hypothetical protein
MSALTGSWPGHRQRPQGGVATFGNARKEAFDLAQPASQTISAMMGADLGHLCALQHGGEHRELSRGHWRMRAIAGVQHKTIGVRDSSP